MSANPFVTGGLNSLQSFSLSAQFLTLFGPPRPPTPPVLRGWARGLDALLPLVPPSFRPPIVDCGGGSRGCCLAISEAGEAGVASLVVALRRRAWWWGAVGIMIIVSDRGEDDASNTEYSRAIVTVMVVLINSSTVMWPLARFCPHLPSFLSIFLLPEPQIPTVHLADAAAVCAQARRCWLTACAGWWGGSMYLTGKHGEYREKAAIYWGRCYSCFACMIPCLNSPAPPSDQPPKKASDSSASSNLSAQNKAAPFRGTSSAVLVQSRGLPEQVSMPMAEPMVQAAQPDVEAVARPDGVTLTEPPTAPQPSLGPAQVDMGPRPPVLRPSPTQAPLPRALYSVYRDSAGVFAAAGPSATSHLTGRGNPRFQV
eukprot:813513-Rhodomonas_salina.1